MTPEEMTALLEAQNEKIASLEATAVRVAELEAKVNPPVEDPDDAYKPKTWKDNRETIVREAEAAAMRILQDADKKKDDIRKKEQADDHMQAEKIDEAFAKLQEEGILEESKNKDDEGGKQRQQALGLALRMGGVDVEAAARSLKTVWENGFEYNYDKNAFIPTKGGYNTVRNAPVASAATRTASAPSGRLDLRGIKGDLDEAERRYMLANK